MASRSLLIMKKNNIFWNNFYKKFNLNLPSGFAKFILKNKYFNKGHILDVGCGNGRDTFYFLKFGYKIIGIDKSSTAVKLNKKILPNNFFKANICSKKFNINSITNKKIMNIYARFFIHAINTKEQFYFFKNLRKISSKNIKIFLEFRTIKDPMMRYGKKITENERISDHYRRFINVREIQNELKNLGYKILYKKESFNFAKFKNQKPHICRMILISR